MNDTFIKIDFWQLVGFLLSFLGVCWGFGKMLLAQFQIQQDERQRAQDVGRTGSHYFNTQWCRQSI